MNKTVPSYVKPSGGVMVPYPSAAMRPPLNAIPTQPVAPRLPADTLAPTGKELPLFQRPLRTTDRTPAALFEEATLSPGVHVMWKRYGDIVRVAYDPAQISRTDAGVLLALHHGSFAFGHTAAVTEKGSTIIAELPMDEDPVRITTHDGRVTVVFDDRRISGAQLLELMEQVTASDEEARG